MTPILYEATETQFLTNGLGRLSDCIDCTVTEERNGTYEATFQYPEVGTHFEDIIEGRIIYCTHDETGDRQPFIIYGREASIEGIVTFHAHHISYRLANMIVQPFSAESIADAFVQIPLKTYGSNPFTFWTDKETTKNYQNTLPRAIRSMLGGEENSILQAFGGGDYEFDKFAVKLYQNRGTNSGVTIRYGKNLSQLNQETSTLEYFDGVVPYWSNGETSVVLDHIVGGSITQILDLSGEFEEAPTTEELEEAAQNYLDSRTAGLMSEHLEFDFIQLWQTEEYKEYAPLQRVKLCDTVTVIVEGLRIDKVEQKVTSVTWDVLDERYTAMELGGAQNSLADVIREQTQAMLENVPTKSMMAESISHATDLITGADGGYVVTRLNADGQPEEFLVMDSPDINTAVNVWRFNINGLGHSSNGYDGNYDIAMLMDGQINADMITTGTMSANIIRGGVLALGSEANVSGQLKLFDEDNNLIGEMTKDGLKMFGSSGYVLLNYEEGLAGYDLEGNKIYWVDDGSFHMKLADVTEEITLCGLARFIQITNSANNGIGLISVGGE